MTQNCGIIFPAAGQSTRFGESKLFYELLGMPVFCHAIQNFSTCGCPLFLAVQPQEQDEFQEKLHRHLPDVSVEFCPGGSSRTETVFHALTAMHQRHPDLDYVAIHDAARPLATAAMLEKALAAAEKTGAAVVGRRATSTFKWVQNDGITISKTIPRQFLWEAETPQVFRTDLLLAAYQAVPWRTMPLTDDASLIEESGLATVVMVDHTGFNQKISFKEDLAPILAALALTSN